MKGPASGVNARKSEGYGGHPVAAELLFGAAHGANRLVTKTLEYSRGIQVEWCAVGENEIETSFERAKKVLSQIRARQYSAAPTTYEVLYRTAGHADPALKREVDRIRAEKGRLEPADIDGLAGEFVLSPAAERITEIGGLLSHELKHVLSTLELAQIETNDRANQLSRLSRTRETSRSDQLRALIQALMMGAKDMEKINRQLEAELSGSMKEIKRLKASLEKARTDSRIDPLTMLKNRKSFDEALSRVLGKALSAKHMVCLMMVDIDHFKRINDQFGHLVGDQVIRMIASIMKDKFGDRTHLARYGGEEFVALITGCSIDAALRTTDEFRRQIADRPFKLRSTGEMIGNVTVSIGVAALRNTDTAQSLVERADQSLYLAKQKGRNRTASERDLGAAA